MSSSIFLDLALPNSTTWFYCSFFLTIALFFRFDRVFSLRHSDILGLFLMIPGLLCIQEAHALKNLLSTEQLPDARLLIKRSNGFLLAGYIWLISGSFVWFLRCMIDLGLEKRPMLPPNMNMAGLSFFIVFLFICLAYTAYRQLPHTETQWGRGPIALTKVNAGAFAVVSFQSGRADWELTDTRFWIERSVALLAHLLVIVALIAIGKKTFNDTLTGLSMANLYLLLPCTGYQVSQLHHIWPTLFFLGAILWHRQPFFAGCLLGAATGSVFFPILLFPLWFGFYRGRGTGRFCLGFFGMLTLSLALTAAALLWSGQLRQYLQVALNLSDWQAWKAPKTESIWLGSHWAYRLPVFVAYMSFIILTIFWPSPRHLGHVIAQSAAVVIGVQFWYADQGGVYILWYMPLLLLMIFRPNVSHIRPPEHLGPFKWKFWQRN